MKALLIFVTFVIFYSKNEICFLKTLMQSTLNITKNIIIMAWLIMLIGILQASFYWVLKPLIVFSVLLLIADVITYRSLISGIVVFLFSSLLERILQLSQLLVNALQVDIQ